MRRANFRRRKPAWTDRILHLSADPTMVFQTSYQSSPMVTLSDHQPVSADFNIAVSAAGQILHPIPHH